MPSFVRDGVTKNNPLIKYDMILIPTVLLLAAFVVLPQAVLYLEIRTMARFGGSLVCLMAVK
jgi:hypothetical protein